MKPGESVWIITHGPSFERRGFPTPCSSLEGAIRTAEHISEFELFRISPLQWESYNGGDGMIARFQTKPLAYISDVMMLIYRHTMDEYDPLWKAVTDERC